MSDTSKKVESNLHEEVTVHPLDLWNEEKKKIDSGSEGLNRFPKECEVWIAALGRNIGYEQNGNGNNFARPVLIVKKFNNHMFWCVPLSSKQKQFNFYFNYVDPNQVKVSAVLAQLKLLSVKRCNRKLYEISKVDFMILKEKLCQFLQ
jgi:mRNA interferase MazF